MAQGQPFQAALSRYKKPKALWRPGPWGDPSRNIVPCGSFVYCRDLQIVERMLELQDDNRDWYDEQVYSAWVDEVCGGWPGVERYQELGYQPEDVLVHRPYFVPKDVLFFAPLKTWKYTPPAA